MSHCPNPSSHPHELDERSLTLQVRNNSGARVDRQLAGDPAFQTDEDPMTPRKFILFAAGLAALAIPAAASAQYYAQPRGDFYQGRRSYFRGYPEFRNEEMHIRQEIDEGVREDLLAPEDAADFRDRLRQIQVREAREFREHGRYLPDYDRAAIRAQLDELDRLVDQTRDEP
jgi:hypothetical protein